MKEKKSLLFLGLIIMVVCCVTITFEKSKVLFHLDEILSMGLSNSHYAPFFTSIKDGNIIDTVFTKKELLDYVTVGNERFDYASVWYNQEKDVHPPLYYLMLNSICSFFPGFFSKWIPFGLNLFFYIGTLILLYKFIKELFNDNIVALSSTLLYGLSEAGLSTILFVRMYMVLTFFSMVFSLCILKIHKSEKRSLWYPLLALSVFLGSLTQYFFVIFAFFVCLTECIYGLVKKKYVKTAIIAVLSLLGLLLMILVFPACLSHITKGTGSSGRSVTETFFAFSEYAEKIKKGLEIIIRGHFPVIFIIIFYFICMIIGGFKLEKNKLNKFGPLPFIFMVSALLTILAVLCITTMEPRYVYNIMPFMTVFLAYVYLIYTDNSEKEALSINRTHYVGLLLVMLLINFFVIRIKLPYLHFDGEEYEEKLEPVKNCPCIFFSRNSTLGLATDFQAVTEFEDIYVTDGNINDSLLKYIEDHECNDEIVVFIAPKRIKNGELSDLKEKSEKKEQTLLYSRPETEVYLLK